MRRHAGHDLPVWLARASPEVGSILDDALSGVEITAADATILLGTRGDDAHASLAVADELRRRSIGEDVTYVVNRNINFTNVCVKRCGFCAFSRTAANREGYYLPLDEIVRRAVEAAHLGATEVCIQAGLPPQMEGDLYAKICRAIKSELPDIHIHGFSPEEIVYGASRAKCSVAEFLALMIDAGVGSLPGTSAEILDDRVRDILAPNRLSTQQWLSVVRAAHGLGLRTTATCMYGHCETYSELAAHICLIRDTQRETGGFTEFVPLSFVSSEAPLYLEQHQQHHHQQQQIAGETVVPDHGRLLRSGPTHRERLLTHAVSRIILHGHIDNIQGSWVKEGLDTLSELVQHCGVSDVGGTLMNESISTAAGSSHGQMMRPSTLRTTIRQAGRVPVERSTLYETIRRFDDAIEEDATKTTWRTLEVGRLESLEQLEEADAASVFGSFGSMSQRHPPEHSYRNQFARRSRQRHKQTLNQQHGRTMHNVATATPQVDMKVVTYSPSHTVVPTYECFNKCSYCNFRKVPSGDQSGWVNLQEVDRQLRRLAEQGIVSEVLVLAGEVHPGRGLMLEQSSSRLLQPGAVHAAAPSKRPELRRNQLIQAGEKKIPFTTGILAGIGETETEQIRTLEEIAQLSTTYGHIGECIVQPYSPGETEASRDLTCISKGKRRPATALGYDLDDLPALVKRARSILPADVVVQVPPNLVLGERPEVLRECLEAGATDLGGISPFDEVNPSYPFPTVSELRRVLGSWGYILTERLPLHDKHTKAPWVRPRVLPVMEKWSARMQDHSYAQSLSK